jgi:transposase
MHETKFIGLDVHKDTIVIAVAEGGRDGEVRNYGTISNDLHALEKALRKLGLGHASITLHVVYEAGPCGFVIHRRLTQLAVDCIVVSPSLIPKKKGERIKTDRRDALALARLHRAGELTAIHVPDAVDESVRDLARARADAVADLTRARHRLKGFLLRLGYKYRGKSSWTDAHRKYLRELELPLPVHKAVLEENLKAIDEADTRVARLGDLLAATAPQWRHYAVVQALMCFRGFQVVAATTIVAELGDTRRFDHPRQLMAYLGLIPGEHSSGGTRRLGGITKAGNAHARWMMIEAAQHYRLPPKVSAQLTERQRGQPRDVCALGWKAQTRLYKRYWQLAQRGLFSGKIQVALARELTGFVWDVMRHSFEAQAPRA